MGKANFRVLGVIAALLVLANVLIARAYDLPVNDPDGVIAPMYVQLPFIVLLAFLLDVAPRAALAAHRAGGVLGRFSASFVSVVRERWTREHVVFMVAGLGAWYACYATFRNLKSYVPFVNHHLWDPTLARIDKTIFLGHHPANVLHSLLGTGLAAHVLSGIYILWIGLIPVTLAIALVFTRNVVKGSWYVTAVAFDWVIGVALYYLVPTLGPIYSRPGDFAALPHTYVSTLEAQLWRDRLEVLHAHGGSDVVQTIAAFPSLHVGMAVTICAFATWAGLPRIWRVISWVFLALTVVSTIYLGWHFFVDTVAGAVVGTLATWLAALATGNATRLRPQPATVPQLTAIDSESARA